ncbi:MAG: YdcF family protein [Pseudomonadota bacterium]|nr:YdcF family protein [Pseudomonadota bacterium]
MTIFIRSKSRSRRRIRLLTWLAALLILSWLAGLWCFADTMPVEPDHGGLEKLDAVVVLTGGDGRLMRGFDLIEQELGTCMFVSGVYRGVEVRELLEIARETADIEAKINLGYDADDTPGNAAETKAWVEKTGVRSFHLVTAHYHIRRAMLEMKMTMPNIHIKAHPVIPPSFGDKHHRWLLIGEYNKYLFTLVRYAKYRLT